MKNRKIIYGLVAFLFVFLFAWNKYQIKTQKDSVEEKISPPQFSENCGLQDCHGLDIVCGPDIPEVCDLMYGLGDGCRKFARCQIVDGQCELKKDDSFDNCKSCVEKCEVDYVDDLVSLFKCEGECIEQD